jgi:hypothetical protein
LHKLRTHEKTCDEPVQANKGERVGTSWLGSAVAMLSERDPVDPAAPPFELDTQILRVRCGEPTGSAFDG